MIKKILVWLAILSASSANAQFNAGQVLTASALNNQFSLYMPLSGGALTGPLSVPSLNVSGALTAGTLSPSALSTSNATITGGAIDGSAIGQNSPAAGNFTTINVPTVTMSGSLPAGSLGLLTVQNPQTSATTAGQTAGIKVCNCNGTETSWLINPSAGDYVAGYFYVNSNANRNRIWAINPIVDIQGTDATAWIAEFDMNNMIGNAPNPGNTNTKIGVSISSGGSYAPAAALSLTGTKAANAWKYGIWFNYLGYQTGSALFHTNPNVSVDYGLDMSQGAYNYQAVRIGATPASQVAAIGLVQPANGTGGIWMQRNTDTSPTGNMISLVDAANANVLAAIDVNGNFVGKGGSFTSFQSSGATTVGYTNPRLVLNDTSGSNSSGLQWQSSGATAWNFQNASSSSQLCIARYVSGAQVDTPLCIANPTGIVSFVDGITVKGTSVLGNLSGTSGSIGGSALAAGACTSGTASISGATSSMTVTVSPSANPGAGFDWNGYVSASGTVTVNLCAIAAGTPTATIYNVRVIQ
ncbi:hypothetical protein [Burkholderia anthina]|uniref:hypothetical protein n=1 Tax=Burkholderia anthina TaxID=179879 RepID=UPI00158AAB93|nr:hypothetical protein [Burkholderia anthina]